MPRRRLLQVACMIVVIGTILSQEASAATRLGLHVTQEELTIWGQRATSGPYKTAGDVSTNSPGDWDRIVTNRNAFAANPSYERWTQPEVTDGCVYPNPNTYGWPEPGDGLPYWSIRLRDAAFYGLVTGSTADRAAIKQELLWVSSQPFTQWGNPNGPWCFGIMWDIAPSFGITSILTRVLYAYDYLGRGAFTQSELDQLDRWFFDAADYWRRDMDFAQDDKFVDRWGGNYAPTQPCDGDVDPFVGGPVIQSYAKYYNQRRGAIIRFSALAGLYLQQAGRNYTNGRYGTLAQAVQSGTMFVQEAIRYTLFPQGLIGDFERRGAGGNNDGGWAYAGNATGELVMIADAFARAGDTSLYTYNTNQGLCGTQGTINDGGSRTGQNKDLLFAVQSYMKYITDVYARYWPDTSTEDNRIDGRHPRDGSGTHWVHETSLVPANVYFKDNFVKQAYTRTHPNSIPYGGGVWSGPPPWMGEVGTLPAVLFMYGNMEDQVNPYAGGSSPSVTLTAAPATIFTGQSSTLSWSSTNVTSCTASDGWSGSKATSGTEPVAPTQTTTYTLTCTGPEGSANDAVTVTVVALLTQARINAGGPQFVATDGTYQADQYSTGGATFSTGVAIANTTDDTLYQTERYGNVTYALPLVNGTYNVTLKFAELFWTGTGQRVFHVDLNGTRVLTSLDIVAQAGGINTALDYTFPVTVSTELLSIVFTTVVDNAKVSAIKVEAVAGPPGLSAPRNLRTGMFLAP